MSADATSLNLKQWSQNQEFDKIASFFTTLTGSTEKTKALLQNVVDSLNNTSRKRSAPLPSPSHTPSRNHSFLVQDALDEAVVTSLIQIPNDKSVIGAIIGPQGKNIKEMTTSTGCLVNLDQKSQTALNRTAPIVVFLQGPLRAVVKVVELLSLKVESVVADSSAVWTATGSGVNRTIMIIPDSLVKRVIGRGGTTVTKLQQDSGSDIQLQSEAKMASSPDPLFGREALLTGPLSARLHGLYLICRLLLEDKECPPAWSTSHQFPTPIQRGGGASSSMVITSNGVFSQVQQSAPVPPQPHQQGQQGQQGLAYAIPQQHQQQQPLQGQRPPYMGNMGQMQMPSSTSLAVGGGNMTASPAYSQFQSSPLQPLQPQQPQQPQQPPNPIQGQYFGGIGSGRPQQQMMPQPPLGHNPFQPHSFQYQK